MSELIQEGRVEIEVASGVDHFVSAALYLASLDH